MLFTLVVNQKSLLAIWFQKQGVIESSWRVWEKTIGIGEYALHPCGESEILTSES